MPLLKVRQLYHQFTCQYGAGAGMANFAVRHGPFPLLASTVAFGVPRAVMAAGSPVPAVAAVARACEIAIGARTTTTGTARVSECEAPGGGQGEEQHLVAHAHPEEAPQRRRQHDAGGAAQPCPVAPTGAGAGLGLAEDDPAAVELVGERAGRPAQDLGEGPPVHGDVDTPVGLHHTGGGLALQFGQHRREGQPLAQRRVAPEGAAPGGSAPRYAVEALHEELCLAHRGQRHGPYGA